MPLSRNSSTSLHCRGSSTAIISARLPGVSEPSSSPSRAPCADQRGALENLRRRHIRRQPPHRLQLGEQVQIVDAGEAVGADRDLHAGLVEALDRRIADAHPLVAARTGHQRRADRARRASAAVAELHTVDDQRPRVDDADGDRGRSPDRNRESPVVTPRADDLEHAAPGAAALVEELDLLGRLAEVNAHDRHGVSLTAARIALNSSSDVEYGACGASETARRARRWRRRASRESIPTARRRAPGSRAARET